MWEVFLGITGDCNLNCGYCYEKKRRVSKGHALDTCDYSIDDVFGLLENLSKSKDHIHLYFFGGEPTLKPKLLCDWSSRIHDEYPGVYQLLHTNGLLLGTLPPSFFDNLESVIVSVNMEPNLSYGSREFYVATVRENIERMRDISEIPIIIRLTYTLDSNFLETCFLFEDVSDGIYWQIVNISNGDMSGVLKKYYADMKLLMTKWFSQIQKPMGAQYIPFDYAFLVTSNPSYVEQAMAPCGFGKCVLFVDLDGTIYTCPEMINDSRAKVGHIKTGFDMSGVENTAAKILRKCDNCSARAYCRSRCPRMHLSSNISIQREVCKATQDWFGDFIERKEALDSSIKKRYLSHIRGPKVRRLVDVLECVP